MILQVSKLYDILRNTYTTGPLQLLSYALGIGHHGIFNYVYIIQLHVSTLMYLPGKFIFLR